MEIYLTKIILNPRSRQVRSEIGSPQELHRTISNCFEKVSDDEFITEKVTNKNGEEVEVKTKVTPRNKFNILYRLDVDRRREQVTLLVQSTAKLNRDALFAKGYALAVEQKTIHEQYAQIENGMRFRFRLRANPTKRIGKSDQKADERFKPTEKREIRRRVELIGDENKTREEKQIEWLRKKGETRIEIRKRIHHEYGCGFRLGSVSIKENVDNVLMNFEGKQRFNKSSKDETKKTHKVALNAITFEGVLEVTDTIKFREALIKGIGQGKAYGFGLLSIAPVR